MCLFNLNENLHTYLLGSYFRDEKNVADEDCARISQGFFSQICRQMFK